MTNQKLAEQTAEALRIRSNTADYEFIIKQALDQAREQGYQEAVDKSEEWLENNCGNYTKIDVGCGYRPTNIEDDVYVEDEELIADYREAMEKKYENQTAEKIEERG